MLDLWIKFCNLNNPNTLEDILSVNIWDIKDIKVATTIISYKKWFNKQIYYITDLLDADGNFMDIDTFCRQYQIQVNFPEYWGVRSAVESYIRKKE